MYWTHIIQGGSPLYLKYNIKITLYNMCSVHRGMFSTLGGYHEYIEGISWVHRGIFSTMGGYHDECGGIPWVHRGMFSTSEGCSVHQRDVQYIGGIPWVHRGDITSTLGDVQCIGGLSWYMWGSNLIKSFQFLLKTPMYWTSPNVLMISPDVLMVSPWCTEHPPMYWTSPDVLNTHYTGWFAPLSKI